MRVFDAHSGSYILLDLALQVVLQLFVKFPLDFVASEERPKPKTKYSRKAHMCLPRSDCSHDERNCGGQTVPIARSRDREPFAQRWSGSELGFRKSRPAEPGLSQAETGESDDCHSICDLRLFEICHLSLMDLPLDPLPEHGLPVQNDRDRSARCLGQTRGHQEALAVEPRNSRRFIKPGSRDPVISTLFRRGTEHIKSTRTQSEYFCAVAKALRDRVIR